MRGESFINTKQAAKLARHSEKAHRITAARLKDTGHGKESRFLAEAIRKAEKMKAEAEMLEQLNKNNLN